MGAMSPHAIPAAIPAGTGVLVGRPTRYKGITIRETAGAVATVRLYDNPTTNAGTLLATIALAANQSLNMYLPDGGIAATGIYYEKVAGTVEGTVYLG